MGTNTGLKRINTGIDGENYQDLVYVRRRYIHKYALIRVSVNAQAEKNQGAEALSPSCWSNQCLSQFRTRNERISRLSQPLVA